MKRLLILSGKGGTGKTTTAAAFLRFSQAQAAADCDVDAPNLQGRRDGMKRLLILSGKGGTGKTTTAAAFLRFSQAQAAADCDVDAPNLHLMLHPQGQPQRSAFLGGDKAAVDTNRCTGCGECLRHCRFSALTLAPLFPGPGGCGLRRGCPQPALDAAPPEPAPAVGISGRR